MDSTEAAAELRARIRDSHPGVERIAALLDGLAHPERVAAIRSLGRRDQRALFERAAGADPVRLVDLVPPATAAMTPVRHYGRNTLPAFTWFEKRFCRAADEDPARPRALAGFNFQSLAPITGPGYFVARDDPAGCEVLIDYRELPRAHPPDWPQIQSNERGLARLVYGFMIDRLRRVSVHVTIGSATRRGRDLGSWFALVREN
jgi:hypothetical protein